MAKIPFLFEKVYLPWIVFWSAWSINLLFLYNKWLRFMPKPNAISVVSRLIFHITTKGQCPPTTNLCGGDYWSLQRHNRKCQVPFDIDSVLLCLELPAQTPTVVVNSRTIFGYRSVLPAAIEARWSCSLSHFHTNFDDQEFDLPRLSHMISKRDLTWWVPKMKNEMRWQMDS